MKRIKLKKEIFKDIINDDFIAHFHKDIESENNDILDENQINYYINAMKKLFDSFDSIDWVEYKKDMLNVYNNKENSDDKCILSNDDIFTLNINFFIFSLIDRMDTWFYDLVENGLKFFWNDGSLKMVVFGFAYSNFIVYSTLNEIYNSYDAMTYQLLLIKENVFLDDKSIQAIMSDKKNRVWLQKLQNHGKEAFLNLDKLIDTIQMNIGLPQKSFKELVTSFNLLDVMNEYEGISWIVKERNNLTHNCFNVEQDVVFLGNDEKFKSIQEQTEWNKRLKMVLILFVNFILLFYCVIYVLGCID